MRGDERRPPVGAQPRELALQLGSAGYDGLSRERGRRAAEVGELVAQRAVALVADGRHDRRARRSHGPAERLVTKGEQLRGVPAAACEHDDLDVMARVERGQRTRDGLRRARS